MDIDGTKANEWVIGADLDLLHLMSCPPGFVKNELIIHAYFKKSHKWIGVEHEHRQLQQSEVTSKNWIMVLIDDGIEFLQGDNPAITKVIDALLVGWIGDLVKPTIVSKVLREDLMPNGLQVDIKAQIHDLIGVSMEV